MRHFTYENDIQKTERSGQVSTKCTVLFSLAWAKTMKRCGRSLCWAIVLFFIFLLKSQSLSAPPMVFPFFCKWLFIINVLEKLYICFTQATLKWTSTSGASFLNYTRLIYNDITAIKVILFILVLILTFLFWYLGVGVEIILFLVWLSFAFFSIFF